MTRKCECTLAQKVTGDGYAEWLGKHADRLDPSYKLDRSLRGWVSVSDEHETWVWKAKDDGIYDRFEIIPWDEVERHKWKVTKIREAHDAH